MDLTTLTEAQLQDLLRHAEEAKQRHVDVMKLEAYRPYPKQAEFHAAGARYGQRLFSAGNQLGKTLAGAAEMAMHLTGRYPPWWRGRRFTKPIVALAGSESAELTRDGAQRLLLGPPSIEERWGTGFIPTECIVGKPKRRGGIKDAADAIVVRHAQGGNSVISFKSYDQGRAKWQASTVDLVWLDEEPPYDVYEEAVTRTNATNGMVYITFTPLQGMSAVVVKFFTEPGNDRIVITMTIDDVGHYTAEQRDRISASYGDDTRDARTKGLPVLGSGRVFPISESVVTVQPFALPAYWPRLGGLDFGWDHPTACVEIAWDRDLDVIYVVREYRQSKKTAAEHATVLRTWGKTLPYVWPFDGLQTDKGSGIQLAVQYRSAGLLLHQEHVTFPDGTVGVEAGVQEMLTRMNEGRLKVFSTCTNWFQEFNLYHRKDGKLVKINDDLISASRYAMMGRRHAKVLVRDPWDVRKRTVIAPGTGEVSNW